MNHDVTLNIHYSAPDEVWEEIGTVYQSMPYWAGNVQGPKWIGEDIDLWASVEPAGSRLQALCQRMLGKPGIIS